MAYHLHPDALAQVRAEFDERRGYAALYQYALAHGPDPGPALSPLVYDGYAVLPCLSPADVAWVTATTLTPDGASRMAELPEATWRDLLARLIPPPVAAAVTAEFKTPFAVVFAGPTDTRPETTRDPVLNVSYKWHCDGGPEMHLKLIVYLDGPEAHDGATDLVTATASQRLRDLGYGWLPNHLRLTDLTELASDHGLAPLPIHRVSPPSGSGILFNPSRLVHRGVAPTWGRRRTITVGFVPFPVPWPQALPQFLPVIRTNRWSDFPAMVRPT